MEVLGGDVGWGEGAWREGGMGGSMICESSVWIDVRSLRGQKGYRSSRRLHPPLPQKKWLEGVVDRYVSGLTDGKVSGGADTNFVSFGSLDLSRGVTSIHR